jgi:hypothetical protein
MFARKETLDLIQAYYALSERPRRRLLDLAKSLNGEHRRLRAIKGWPCRPLSPDLLATLDAFLIDLNRAAAGAILPLFRADHGLTDKIGGKKGMRGFDPVTEADKGAERAIRALISERYPEHGVIGEEYGEDRPDAEFVWVLDPWTGRGPSSPACRSGPP